MKIESGVVTGRFARGGEVVPSASRRTDGQRGSRYAKKAIGENRTIEVATMFMHVTEARYLGGYRLWLGFNDGTAGEVDLARELARLTIPDRGDADADHVDVSAPAGESVRRQPLKMGLFRGRIHMADDFNDPLPDSFWLNDNP